jgi:hypothetical protein
VSDGYTYKAEFAVTLKVTRTGSFDKKLTIPEVKEQAIHMVGAELLCLDDAGFLHAGWKAEVTRITIEGRGDHE